MARTHYIFAAAVALIALALPAWTQIPVSDRLSAVKGNVTLLRGQEKPALLHEQDEVLAGDSILTDRKSSATMRLPDGNTVRIFPNSHVELRPESGNWKDFLHVLLGNVRVQIEKLSGRPNPKVTTTPTAIIAVRGTVFAVSVEQNGDTQVGLEKGLIEVWSQLHPEQQVLVQPGQEVWVRHGEGPTQPHRMQRSMPGLAAPGSLGKSLRGPGGSKRSSGGVRRGP